MGINYPFNFHTCHLSYLMTLRLFSFEFLFLNLHSIHHQYKKNNETVVPSNNANSCLLTVSSYTLYAPIPAWQNYISDRWLSFAHKENSPEVFLRNMDRLKYRTIFMTWFPTIADHVQSLWGTRRVKANTEGGWCTGDWSWLVEDSHYRDAVGGRLNRSYSFVVVKHSLSTQLLEAGGFGSNTSFLTTTPTTNKTSSLPATSNVPAQ